MQGAEAPVTSINVRPQQRVRRVRHHPFGFNSLCASARAIPMLGAATCAWRQERDEPVDQEGSEQNARLQPLSWQADCL